MLYKNKKGGCGHSSKIITIQGKKVEIDVKLIKVIKALNQCGLTTTQCCQGDKTSPSSLVIMLDASISVSINSLGIDGSQRLCIYWNKNKQDLFI